MNYITCKNCGVVLDADSHAMDHEELYNHDQDMKCDHVQCPVCKRYTHNGDWKEVSE